MSSNDPIKDFSQSVGDGGLDAPNPFQPDLGKTNGVEEDLFEGTHFAAKKAPVTKWIPHARVFIVDESGNPDYEDLLKKGANGEIMLGRKEVGDIKGATAYKIYMEWMIPIRDKKSEEGEE